MSFPSKTQSLTTDVCIIGGGIAGCYLATLLRERRIATTIIEEHTKFGKPCHCAGIMSQKLVHIAAFPKSLIINRVKTAHIVAPNHESIHMSGKDSPIVLDRIQFDTYFGEKARDLGAEFLFGEKYLRHYALKNGQVLVKTDKHDIIAKIVVGADGAHSRVAKLFGITNKAIPAYQVRAKFNYDPKKTMMYFQPRFKELFAYVVPEGKNSICRIGLASQDHPKQAMQEVLEFLKIPPQNIIEEQGGLIPYGFPRKIAFKNTVLLGDAAMMVKATTGGGVVMLMTAAKTLADSIAGALANENYSERYFQKTYQTPIKRGIGLHLKLHYFIRLLLVRLSKYDFNHFFRLYRTTNLNEVIRDYADMDFPILLMRRLIINKYFIRFMLHLVFRHWRLFPQFLHDIAL